MILLAILVDAIKKVLSGKIEYGFWFNFLNDVSLQLNLMVCVARCSLTNLLLSKWIIHFNILPGNFGDTREIYWITSKVFKEDLFVGLTLNKNNQEENIVEYQIYLRQ